MIHFAFSSDRQVRAILRCLDRHLRGLKNQQVGDEPLSLLTPEIKPVCIKCVVASNSISDQAFLLIGNASKKDSAVIDFHIKWRHDKSPNV